jgi:hypothetical protein
LSKNFFRTLLDYKIILLYIFKPIFVQDVIKNYNFYTYKCLFNCLCINQRLIFGSKIEGQSIEEEDEDDDEDEE